MLGHSAADRSVSLLLSDGRVIIHGFGEADWRTMRDALRGAGFIDAAGRLAGSGIVRPGPPMPRPDRRLRVETAARLWSEVHPLTTSDPAASYLRRRAVRAGGAARDLGFHPAAPTSVYRPGRRMRPALIARVCAPDGALSAVEITYLDPNGHQTAGLAVPRKTIGLVPPGAAIRLSPIADEMLVGEGVMTTLSAIDRFGLPGWALMSANNLAIWTPPSGVRRVLIAADRGMVGEGAAGRLRHRLSAGGIEVRVSLPDPPFDDWNAVARGIGKGRSEGGEGRRSGGDGPRRPAGDLP